ncbi:MAG: HAMP domain-containing sensor histidine kinase [Bdellovibrionota bacterium]
MLRERRLLDNVVQIAHDIRSPVFALMAVLESSGEFDDKKRKLIMSVAQRLQDIADGILQENRQAKEVHIASAIQEILNEKKATFPRFEFKFENSTNSDVTSLLNPIEMKRIISNLINNSVEAYEGKTGKIKVSLVNARGVTKITVKDNGKGIPLSLMSQIYWRSFKIGGSGLGLSHAKKYIESIGGKIDVNSLPYQGTEVCISL